MDFGALFLVLALVLLVAMFISRPFLSKNANAPLVSRHSVHQGEHEQSMLLAERDRVLRALQELDFDQALGKIPEEDYQPRRAELMLRGADVLRKLDEHGQGQPASSAEDRLEAAVAARRADASATGTPRRRIVSGSDEEEELIAARHRSRIEKAAGFCPQCGKPVQKSDRFCPRCGASI